MQTFNINITKKQFNIINQMVKQGGFANKREFFRTMLQALLKLSQSAKPLKFQTPPTKNIGEIINSFRQTDKYNEKFLSSLEKGLKISQYFNIKS